MEKKSYRKRGLNRKKTTQKRKLHKKGTVQREKTKQVRDQKKYKK